MQWRRPRDIGIVIHGNVESGRRIRRGWRGRNYSRRGGTGCCLSVPALVMRGRRRRPWKGCSPQRVRVWLWDTQLRLGHWDRREKRRRAIAVGRQRCFNASATAVARKSGFENRGENWELWTINSQKENCFRQLGRRERRAGVFGSE
jgi:hypothetical protein